MRIELIRCDLCNATEEASRYPHDVVALRAFFVEKPELAADLCGSCWQRMLEALNAEMAPDPINKNLVRLRRKV